MYVIAGNQASDEWVVLDESSNPLGGLTGGSGAGGFTNADFKLSLRRQSGTTFVAATETVTLAESATAGHYTIRFTPENNGLYVLHLKELDPLSLGRTFDFRFPVVAAGSVFLPAFANAFCAQSDVERWAQLVFSSTSKPSVTEVAGFAESRASEIRSIVAGEGWNVAPSGVVAGSLEEDVLREANAIGAAADAWLAKLLDTDPGRTEKAAALLEEYQRRIERLVVFAQTLASGAFIRTPMTAGELTLRDEGNTADSGLRDAIRMDTRW